MPEKYIYNGQIVQRSDVEDAAKQSNLDVNAYLQKSGIKVVNDNYNFNGKTVSAEDILSAANQSKLGFDDYIQKANISALPDVKKKEAASEGFTKFVGTVVQPPSGGVSPSPLQSQEEGKFVQAPSQVKIDPIQKIADIATTQTQRQADYLSKAIPTMFPLQTDADKKASVMSGDPDAIVNVVQTEQEQIKKQKDDVEAKYATTKDIPSVYPKYKAELDAAQNINTDITKTGVDALTQVYGDKLLVSPDKSAPVQNKLGDELRKQKSKIGGDPTYLDEHTVADVIKKTENIPSSISDVFQITDDNKENKIIEQVGQELEFTNRATILNAAALQKKQQADNLDNTPVVQKFINATPEERQKLQTDPTIQLAIQAHQDLNGLKVQSDNLINQYPEVKAQQEAQIVANTFADYITRARKGEFGAAEGINSERSLFTGTALNDEYEIKRVSQLSGLPEETVRKYAKDANIPSYLGLATRGFADVFKDTGQGLNRLLLSKAGADIQNKIIEEGKYHPAESFQLSTKNINVDSVLSTMFSTVGQIAAYGLEGYVGGEVLGAATGLTQAANLARADLATVNIAEQILPANKLADLMVNLKIADTQGEALANIISATNKAKNIGGNFGSMYTTSFEQYYQEAAKYTTDETKRKEFASSMASATGLAFTILNPAGLLEKGLTRATGETIAKDFLETGVLPTAKDVFKEKLVDIGKTVGIGAGQSLIPVINENLAKSQILDYHTSSSEFWQQALNSAMNMAVGILPLGVLGASKIPTSENSKSLLFESGKQPELLKSNIEESFIKGEITNEEKNRQISVVNTLQNLVRTVPEKNNEGKILTQSEQNNLVYLQLQHDALVKKKENATEALKPSYDKEIKIQQDAINELMSVKEEPIIHEEQIKTGEPGVRTQDEIISDANNFAEDIKDEGQRNAFLSNPQQGLKEAAQQLHGTTGEAEIANKFYGKRIADLALELYPTEESAKAPLPEGSQDLLSKEEIKKESEKVTKPSTVSGSEKELDLQNAKEAGKTVLGQGMDEKNVGASENKRGANEAIPKATDKEISDWAKENGLNVSTKEDFDTATTMATQRPNYGMGNMIFGKEQKVEERKDVHEHTYPKTGKTYKWTLGVYENGKGGKRYLLYDEKYPDQIDAGAIVDKDGKLAHIRTDKDYRNIGLAQTLLREIKKDYGKIVPSEPISKEGARALYQFEKSQPQEQKPSTVTEQAPEKALTEEGKGAAVIMPSENKPVGEKPIIKTQGQLSLVNTETKEIIPITDNEKLKTVKPPQSAEANTKAYVEYPPTSLNYMGTGKLETEFQLNERQETERKRDLTTIREADDLLDKGWDVQKKLDELENSDNPFISDAEYINMTRYSAELADRLRSMKDSKGAEYNKVLTEMQRVVNAANLGGRETARGLGIRGRYKTVADGSYEEFMLNEKAANRDAPLTENQISTANKEYSELEVAKKKLDEDQKKFEDEVAAFRAEQEFKKIKKGVIRDPRRRREQLEQEREDIVARIKDKWKNTGKDVLSSDIPYRKQIAAIAPDVLKLARNLVEDGFIKLEEVVRIVHDTISGNSDVKITPRDVHDILAGEYSEKRPTRTEAAINFENVKMEAALLNKYEKLLKGEVPKNEKKLQKRNQEIDDLRNKIKNLIKQNKVDNIFHGEEYDPDFKRLESARKSYETKTKNLQERLAKGNFAPEEKKIPVMQDKEIQKKFPEKFKQAQESFDKYIAVKRKTALRLAKQMYENKTPEEKTIEVFSKALNVPRTLMASFDFSAPLRQGIVATIAHPQMASEALKFMFEAAKNENVYNRWLEEVHKSPRWEVAEKTKLGITDPESLHVKQSEEAYQGAPYAEKIPIIGLGVKASERAYIGYLNHLRWNLFNMYADRFEFGKTNSKGEITGGGKTYENNPKLYEGLSSMINSMTGRGNIRGFESAAPVLNWFLFASKLIASRINMLGLTDIPNLVLRGATLGKYGVDYGFYTRLPKELRIEAAKDMLKFIAVGVSVLAIARAAGASVELDPRSSDFGKIKVGNTRWDIWGGFQPYARVITQMVSGQRKATTTGKIYNLNGKGFMAQTPLTPLGTFLRQKLAPVPSGAWDLISGTDAAGQPVTVSSALLSRVEPLLFQDVTAAMKDQGVKALFTVGIPSAFGVGVQTYQNKPKK